MPLQHVHGIMTAESYRSSRSAPFNHSLFLTFASPLSLFSRSFSLSATPPPLFLTSFYFSKPLVYLYSPFRCISLKRGATSATRDGRDGAEVVVELCSLSILLSSKLLFALFSLPLEALISSSHPPSETPQLCTTLLIASGFHCCLVGHWRRRRGTSRRAEEVRTLTSQARRAPGLQLPLQSSGDISLRQGCFLPARWCKLAPLSATKKISGRETSRPGRSRRPVDVAQRG